MGSSEQDRVRRMSEDKKMADQAGVRMMWCPEEKRIRYLKPEDIRSSHVPLTKEDLGFAMEEL